MQSTLWAVFRLEGVAQYLLSRLEVGAVQSEISTLFRQVVAQRLAQCGLEGCHAIDDATYLVQGTHLSQVELAQDALRLGLEGLPLGSEMRRLILPVHAAYIEHPSDREAPQLQLLAALPRLVNPVSHPINAADRYAEAVKRQLEESAICEELRRATHDGRFYQLYQPIVDLTTGKLTAVEALMRIHDSPFGPSQFIPVAETTGYIDVIGEQSLVMASMFWQACREKQVSLKVAVNVSALQLRNHVFGRCLKGLELLFSTQGLLDDFKNGIELEITESQELGLSDYSAVLSYTQRGYKLALDDFGSSSASLQQWMPLPPGKVKIDRRLLLQGEAHPLKFRLLTQLAKGNGSTLVVEGLESAAQLQLARGSGADFGQGFLLGEPMPAERVLDLANKTFDMDTLTWN